MGSWLNPAHDVWKYNPDKHIPDLSSKVIIVTGANSGTGKASVIELAKHNPKRLYLGARSQAKYDAAMEDVRKVAPTAQVDFLQLDLASFASVKTAVDEVLASNERLDVLINNAGIMGAPPGKTQEGYEVHFGTNHMGTALFTKLLMPLLLKTAEEPGSDVRIANLSSEGHNMAPGGDFLPDKVKEAGEDTHTFRKYGTSKLANILHARELAKRYPTIKSVSIHPGRVQTALLDKMLEKRTVTGSLMNFYDRIASPLTPEQGARTQLWAATWPNKDDVVSGAYYVPFGKLSQGSKRSRDMALSEQLWNWQEQEFKRLGYA